MLFKTYIKIYDKSKRNLRPNNLNLKKNDGVKNSKQSKFKS